MHQATWGQADDKAQWHYADSVAADVGRGHGLFVNAFIKGEGGEQACPGHSRPVDAHLCVRANKRYDGGNGSPYLLRQVTFVLPTTYLLNHGCGTPLQM